MVAQHKQISGFNVGEFACALSHGLPEFADPSVGECRPGLADAATNKGFVGSDRSPIIIKKHDRSFFEGPDLSPA
jgi:hypothetical protein